MIDLSNYNNCQIEVKSSKGNQPKWLINNVYYKQDYLGYEGLSEYVVSQLLKKSNLNIDEFVDYKIDEIKSETILRNGCYSNNFLNENESLVTLNRLYKNRYNRNLALDVFRIEDMKERVIFLTNRISELSGIKNFGIYLTKIIEIDAFFLNEDRHFNNIAVIRNDAGKYSLCKIFDNGSSLLSDTFMDYPMSKDIFSLIKKVKSRTIAWDFYEQLEAFESVYGQQLTFYFTKKDIEEVLSKVTLYNQETTERIRSILFEQKRRYSYLFK